MCNNETWALGKRKQKYVLIRSRLQKRELQNGEINSRTLIRALSETQRRTDATEIARARDIRTLSRENPEDCQILFLLCFQVARDNRDFLRVFYAYILFATFILRTSAGTNSHAKLHRSIVFMYKGNDVACSVFKIFACELYFPSI